MQTAIQRAKLLLPHSLKRVLALIRSEVALKIGIDRYSWLGLDGLDKKVAQFLPKKGVFLEVGANDGFTQSNTYYLEKVRGWSGVLVEPLPRLARRCRLVRPRSTVYEVVLASEATAGSFVRLADSDLTTVALGLQNRSEESFRLDSSKTVAEYSVLATTVSRVLSDSGVGRVDFISIDVEGAELELLEGLDKGSWCPTWLLIETRNPELVRKKLEPEMTLHEKLSHHDYLFRNVEGAGDATSEA